MPLIQFGRQMNFVDWNGSLVGYLFNQTFVACAVGVYLILIAAEDRRPSVWQIGLGIGLSIWLAEYFASLFGCSVHHLHQHSSKFVQQ